MAVTINGTNGITFNNSSTQAQSPGMSTSATAQTWQNVTASRAAATTYTNSTGYPMMITICTGGGASSIYILIDGVNMIQGYQGSSANFTGSIIVPNGSTYSVSGGSLQLWSELR